MKNLDDEAAGAGIEARVNVIEGLAWLSDSLYGLNTVGDLHVSLGNIVVQARLILENTPKHSTAVITTTRENLIEMRGDMLSAGRMDMSVLVTHAIWWLATILEMRAKAEA